MTSGRSGRATPPPLELWGGLECTVNRVGDTYLDQLAASGHDLRPDDLDRIAALGVRALRYPILWERTAPEGPERADWSWPDERLGRLRALGVRPIVGLVHHGSGPRHTSLVDPRFPEGLAAYAGAVAERYPWVDAYTPVNEPLTTARFSGLYGHWYPHGGDELTFARALLTQCRAVVLAMRAIREVNPRARLVQTDDLGKTYSTPRLAYQAAFDNERRWLTWDLLCGRVLPGHRMWEHLTWLGVPEQELAWFAAHPCPPDVVGVNTYVTSERFLDHRTDRYPPEARGGNGRDAYADVEAVRVLAGGSAGAGALLREAWERYRLPVAVTEAHLGCTREEQLRWLLEVWRSAGEAREAGAEVVAVTAWSLLGAYDWDSLVTRQRGHYEPGAFDLRGPRPRPTALARLLPELAAGAEPSHPALASPGWWRRDRRLLYPPVRRAWPGAPAPAAGPRRGAPPAPILILGAHDGDALAGAFARLCDLRGLEHHLLDATEVEDAGGASALAPLRPWAVVFAGGTASAGDAVAAYCAERRLPLLTLTSDLVPDGSQRGTGAADRAAGVPGARCGSTAVAESTGPDLACQPPTLLVRTGLRFGPWAAHDPLVAALSRLAAGKPYAADGETVISPTYVPDLVHASLDLLVDGEGGLWHLANPGATTWYDLVGRAAQLAGVGTECLEWRPAPRLSWRDARTPLEPLTDARGPLLPSLTEALERFLYEAQEAGVLMWAPGRARGAPRWPRRRPRTTRSSEAAA